MFIDFRERGQGAERETTSNQNADWLPPIRAPTGVGIEAATQAGAPALWSWSQTPQLFDE